MELSSLVGVIPWHDLARFVISCLVAVLCGLIIGIERESKGKPAGLRTLVLISLGSCLFVEVSLLISLKVGDPGRVAAQIVTGIGFLGAGAIIQKSEQGYVAGLTTAASIWVTAAVGMMVGLGYYAMAIAGVSIVVIALRLLGSLEAYLFYDSNIEVKRILFESNFGKTKWEIMGLIEENMIRPDEYLFHNGSQGHPCLEFKYVHKNKNHRAFLAQIATLSPILEIN